MSYDMETVAECIGDAPATKDAPVGLFYPAVLPETPELPPPGIYFGMPEEHYHALPALSSHGIRKLAASPMLFWAQTPWVSELGRKRHLERLAKAEEKQHLIIGKAYHCRIMEGREEFDRRFAIDLSEEECKDALVHTDQIKAAITGAGEKPLVKVPDQLPDNGGDYMRTAKKADWIAQLLEIDPAARILDVMQDRHRAAHQGKQFISREAFEQIEIAAKMIDADPEVRHAFRDGYAEVVLIWTCPRTGVPMKARVDYLKLRAVVDLKSLGNQRERSLENAIRWEIASYHYNVQPSVYAEGIEIVRRLVREKAANIAVSGDCSLTEPEAKATIEWARKWAASTDLEWLWVFQQKGKRRRE